MSLGGLHVLLRTLETFPREEQLQDYGVTVLCNISTLGRSTSNPLANSTREENCENREKENKKRVGLADT